jgi:hypothetical protein
MLKLGYMMADLHAWFVDNNYKYGVDWEFLRDEIITDATRSSIITGITIEDSEVATLFTLRWM